MSRRQKLLFSTLVLLTLAVGLYARNLDDYFIGDDFDLIRTFQDVPASYYLKLLVYNESGEAWKHIGFDPEKGGYLRPLKIWLLALDFHIWGTRAAGFHVTSTALFAFTLVMVFRLARRLLGRDQWVFPLLAAFVAGVHPVFAELVPFITAREELLASGFALAALHAFVGHRQTGRGLTASCVWLTLALLSKESGLIALLLMGGYDLATGGVERWPLRGWISRARSYLAPLAVVGVYLGLRVVAFGNPVGGWGAGRRFFSLEAFADYHANFVTFLFHWTMFAWHDVPGIRFVVPGLTLAALVLLWRGRAALGRRERANLLFAGPVWYLATSLFSYGVYFSTRHNAMPVIGLALFGSLLLDGLLRGRSPRLRRAGAAAAALLAALALVPPGAGMSAEFDAASRVVREARERIERETAHLTGSDCRVKLLNAPVFADAPFYFGWGLQSALRRPFTASDLAARCEVVSWADLNINERASAGADFDAVIHLELVPAPSRGSDWPH